MMEIEASLLCEIARDIDLKRSTPMPKKLLRALEDWVFQFRQLKQIFQLDETTRTNSSLKLTKLEYIKA